MPIALIYFGISTVILLLLCAVYLYEDAKGRRVFFPSARAFLDRIFVVLHKAIRNTFVIVWFKCSQFVLRHGVHKTLAAIVSYLKGLEHKVEDSVLRNRHSVTQEKSGRTHLDDIADHKESTALSEKDRKKMRSH